jgi:hypothetical protein
VGIGLEPVCWRLLLALQVFLCDLRQDEIQYLINFSAASSLPVLRLVAI